MRSKLGIGIGWILVTLAAVAVTFAAVFSVRDNVTEPAVPAFRVESSPMTTATDSAAASAPTTSAPAAVTQPNAGTDEHIQTFVAVGGTVTVEAGDGSIFLLGAVPNPGFSVEHDDESDNTRIEIEFESASHKSKIRVELEGGLLVADIDESPES